MLALSDELLGFCLDDIEDLECLFELCEVLLFVLILDVVFVAVSLEGDFVLALDREGLARAGVGSSWPFGLELFWGVFFVVEGVEHPDHLLAVEILALHLVVDDLLAQL